MVIHRISEITVQGLVNLGTNLKSKRVTLCLVQIIFWDFQ